MAQIDSLLWALSKSDGVLQYVKDTGMSLHGLDPYQTDYNMDLAAATANSVDHFAANKPQDWTRALAQIMMEAHIQRSNTDAATIRQEMQDAYEKIAWNIFGNGAHAFKIYDIVSSMLKDEFLGKSSNEIDNYSCLAVIDKYNWDTSMSAKYGVAPSTGALVYNTANSKFEWDGQAMSYTDWFGLPNKAKEAFGEKMKYYNEQMSDVAAAADDVARDSLIAAINNRIVASAAVVATASSTPRLKSSTGQGAGPTVVAPSGYLNFDKPTYTFSWGTTEDPQLFIHVPKNVRKALSINSMVDLSTKGPSDVGALNLVSQPLLPAPGAAPVATVPPQGSTTAIIPPSIQRRPSSAGHVVTPVVATSPSFITFDPQTYIFSWGTAEDPNVFSKVPLKVRNALSINSEADLLSKGQNDVNALNATSQPMLPVAGAAQAPAATTAIQQQQQQSMFGPQRRTPSPLPQVQAVAPDSTEVSPYFPKIVETVKGFTAKVLGFDANIDFEKVVKTSQAKIFTDLTKFPEWFKTVLVSINMPNSTSTISDTYSGLIDWSKYDANVQSLPAISSITDVNTFDPNVVATGIFELICSENMRQSIREASPLAASWSSLPAADVTKCFETVRKWFPHCTVIGKDWYTPMANAIKRRTMILNSPQQIPSNTTPVSIWGLDEMLTASDNAALVMWAVFTITTHILGVPPAYSGTVEIQKTRLGQESESPTTYIEYENRIFIDFTEPTILSLDNSVVNGLVIMCLSVLVKNQPVKSVADKAGYMAIVGNMINRPIMKCMMNAFSLWIGRYMLWKQDIVDDNTLFTIDTPDICAKCLEGVLEEYNDSYDDTKLEEPPSSGVLIGKMIECITLNMHDYISITYEVKQLVDSPLEFWKDVITTFTANWLGTIMRLVQGKKESTCNVSPVGPAGNSTTSIQSKFFDAVCSMVDNIVETDTDKTNTRAMDWYMWVTDLWAAVPKPENAFAELLTRGLKTKHYFLANGSELQKAKEIKGDINSAYNQLVEIDHAPLPLTVEEVLKAEILDPLGVTIDSNGIHSTRPVFRNIALVKLARFMNCESYRCIPQVISMEYESRKGDINAGSQGSTAPKKIPKLWTPKPLINVIEHMAALYKLTVPEVTNMTNDLSKQTAAAEYSDEIMAQFNRFEMISESNARKNVERFYITNFDLAKSELGIPQNFDLTSTSRSIAVRHISEELDKRTSDEIMDLFYNKIVDVIFAISVSADGVILNDDKVMVANAKKLLNITVVGIEESKKLTRNETITKKAQASAVGMGALAGQAAKTALNKAKPVVSVRESTEIAKSLLVMMKDFLPPQTIPELLAEYKKIATYSGSSDDEIKAIIDTESLSFISDILNDETYWLLLSTTSVPWHIFVMQAVKKVYDFYSANSYGTTIMGEVKKAAYVKLITASTSVSSGKRGQPSSPSKKYVKVDPNDMVATRKIVNDFIKLVLTEINCQALVLWYHRYEHREKETMVYIAKMIWGKFYNALKEHIENATPAPTLTKMEADYIIVEFYEKVYRYINDKQPTLVPHIDAILWCIFFNDFRRIETGGLSSFKITVPKKKDVPERDVICTLKMLNAERTDINGMMSKLRIMLEGFRSVSLFHDIMYTYSPPQAKINERTTDLKMKFFNVSKANIKAKPTDAQFTAAATDELIQEEAVKSSGLSAREASSQIKKRDLFILETISAAEGVTRKPTPRGAKIRGEGISAPNEAVIAQEIQGSLITAKIKELNETFKIKNEAIDPVTGKKVMEQWMIDRSKALQAQGYSPYIADKLAKDQFYEYKKSTVAEGVTSYAQDEFTPEFLKDKTAEKYQGLLKTYNAKFADMATKDADEIHRSVFTTAVSLGYEVPVTENTPFNSYLVYVKRMASKKKSGIVDALAVDVAAETPNSVVKSVLGAPEVGVIAAADDGTLGELFKTPQFTQDIK